MISVNLKCSKTFLTEAQYIFNFFCSALGTSFQFVEEIDYSVPVMIYYGKEIIPPGSHPFIIHIADGQYYETLNEVKLSSAEKTNEFPKSDVLSPKLFYLFSGELPFLQRVWYQDHHKSQPVITVNEKAVNSSIDIIATSFYLLSLENERRTSHRDELNRFHRDYSPLGDEIYQYPIIDQYLLLLERFIKQGSKSDKSFKFESRWPNDHSFALSLSHDVDSLRTWTFSKAKRTLRESWKESKINKFLTTTIEIIYSASLRENWSGNFRYITELERKYDGSSTFFFASKRRTPQDPIYKLKWKRIVNGFMQIMENNSFIGLHGTIPSYETGNYLAEERAILEKSLKKRVKGLRQHFLRFDINQTLDAIAEAGFQYDSTLGFSYHLGYRCGTSMPFFPFNPKTGKRYSFLEIPLIVMDIVLYLESRLYLTGEEAWNILEQHLTLAYENGGCFTVNWHNNNINIADAFGYSKMYQKMLKWAFERNAWICSLDDLNDWWIQKTKPSKVEEN
jgi:hypothetical protein